MLRKIFALSLAATLWLLAGPATAVEYRSLTDNAVVYDACSTKATPVFILLKDTPVEVIVSIDKWVKIREQSGGLGCVESNLLGNAQHVIVTETTAGILDKPDDKGKVLLSVARNVVLNVVEKPSGQWLKVRHRDGQTGYISLKSVWGI